MTKQENIPKEHIGIIGLKHVAKNDTAVVVLVTNMALEAFLKVYASRKATRFFKTLICYVCFHWS